MSAAKRSRSRRQPEARDAEGGHAQNALPAQKRLKSSHTPAKTEGLDFLVDEDARQGRKVEGRLTNGVPDQKTTRVDESKAVVAPEVRGGEAGKANEVIDISSAAEESSDYESDEEKGNGVKVNGHASALQTPAATEDVNMEDGEPEQEEPSFGDMLQARHPEPIDVATAFPGDQPESRALAPATGNHVLAAPTGTSLSTVLTQALRTNDKDMLESCFQMADQQSIRTTIQRLQSHLVGPLMQKLAERIHRRPGRTGHLMTWVQWSLVAHGGYLVTQPEILKKLRALNTVMRERAQGLQPLLQLKGKLDMLGAQLELRRQTLANSAGARDDQDDEEGVLYIENQDSNDDGSQSDTEAPKAIGNAPRASKAGELEYHTEDSDSDSASDLPNGIAHAADDSADDDEDEGAGNGMFDLEAEESDDDDDDEADAGSEDEDESSASSASGGAAIEDEDSDGGEEIVVKQPKPQNLQRKR